MRLRLLIPLLGLRHQLFWAKARSRNAKIFLAVGFFLVGWIALMLAMGGGGIGVVAARFGHPILIADFAFGMVFVCALAGALAFGLDSPSALSDESLRRYPLTRRERQGARYAAGLLDPLWLFALVLDLGVAAGFAAVGLSAWWLAVPAAILFFLTTYIAARLLVELVGRIMAMRGGPIVLVLAFLLLFAFPATLIPVPLMPNRFHHPQLLAVLRLSPPVAAASLVARAPALASAGAMLLLMGWFLGVGAALVSLEGRPVRSKAVAGAEATWGSLYDRVAAAFGPALAPLVGKILRYYSRGPMFWFNCLLVPIVVAWFALHMASQSSDPLAGFLTMLAMITVVGYGTVGAMTGNIFGFDQSGFRRYFLLPVTPMFVLRAVAIVPLVLGGILTLISLNVWLVLWHGHMNARMTVMLISSGTSGLLLFETLGLWTSLLSPRAFGLKPKFGKMQPFAQNVVMFAAILAMLFLPLGLLAIGSRTVFAYWWAAPLLLLLAVGFFLVTLREGGRVLREQRERMLFTIEGSK